MLSAWNDVTVHTGKGYVEVGPRDINKGSMVEFICARQTDLRGCPPDFVLCIGAHHTQRARAHATPATRSHGQPHTARGTHARAHTHAQHALPPAEPSLLPSVPPSSGDDSADEFMFAALHARYGQADGTQLFTCTVGRKPSAASFYLSDHERVLELLTSMRMQSAGSKKFHSVGGNMVQLDKAPLEGAYARGGKLSSIPSGVGLGGGLLGGGLSANLSRSSIREGSASDLTLQADSSWGRGGTTAKTGERARRNS